MNRGKGTTSSPAPLHSPEPAPASPAASQPKAASRRSDMPPSLQRSLNAHRRVVTAADNVLEAAEEPYQEPARPSRQAALAPQPDRQAKPVPKVVRKNLTRSASSSSAQPSASSSQSNNAGVNMLYAGLKFTGLALNVAGDLAKSVRQDAEKMMRDLEADAAAKVCPAHHHCSLLHACVKQLPVWRAMFLLSQDA